MRLGIPAIEPADHGDRAGIWRPHAENGAGYAVVGNEMGSHLVVHAVVAALIEEIEVLVGEELHGVGDGGFEDVGHRRGLVYRKECISIQDVAWRYGRRPQKYIRENFQFINAGDGEEGSGLKSPEQE